MTAGEALKESYNESELKKVVEKHEHKMKEYGGVLHLDKMPFKIKNIYFKWRSQRSRCNNKKATSYSWYGAKGIRVEYTSREFIGWWLESIKKFKGKDPVVSRKDHSKNYSLDNIQLESRSSNTKEMNDRLPKTKYIIDIYDIKTKKILFTANGTAHAEKLTGINSGTIFRYIVGKMNQKKCTGYGFKLKGLV